MTENLARLLRQYEGEMLVLEWQDGLRLRVTIDTFLEAEDNEDGLDSIDMKVEEFLRGAPRGMLKPGAWLEIKQNEPLKAIISASGQVIWSAAP